MFAIVSHDAGGAEILSSWALRQKESFLFVLDGPAIEIFERKFGQISLSSLEDAISNSDWILTGTSWQSNLEIRAIIIARSLGKKSISFLDHWVNYRQRFESDEELTLPDEIWVGDEDALRIAKENLPGVDINLKSNPYFEEIRSQIKHLNRSYPEDRSDKYILYVCSPVREHAKIQYGDELHWGFTEEDAVRYFMNNVHVLNHPTGKVVLRPHPSESKDKYNWAIHEFSPNVSIGGNSDLLTEITGADIVVGYNSMAMVIGLIAEKRIINALPPGKIVNSLPLNKIEQMSDLLDSYA